MEWSQNGDSNKWSLNDPLKTLDPEMYNLILEEKDRQRKGSSFLPNKCLMNVMDNLFLTVSLRGNPFSATSASNGSLIES